MVVLPYPWVMSNLHMRSMSIHKGRSMSATTRLSTGMLRPHPRSWPVHTPRTRDSGLRQASSRRAVPPGASCPGHRRRSTASRARHREPSFRSRQAAHLPASPEPHRSIPPRLDKAINNRAPTSINPLSPSFSVHHRCALPNNSVYCQRDDDEMRFGLARSFEGIPPREYALVRENPSLGVGSG